MKTLSYFILFAASASMSFSVIGTEDTVNLSVRSGVDASFDLILNTKLIGTFSTPAKFDFDEVKSNIIIKSNQKETLQVRVKIPKKAKLESTCSVIQVDIDKGHYEIKGAGNCKAENTFE